MFEDTDDGADLALRAGLSDLPVPELSADFDASIQMALLACPAHVSSGFMSYLQALWTACRPAAAAAVVSLCAALMLLHLVQQSPLSLPGRANGSVGADRQLGSRGQGGSFDDMLENMNLTDASLRLFSRPAHSGRNRSG